MHHPKVFHTGPYWRTKFISVWEEQRTGNKFLPLLLLSLLLSPSIDDRWSISTVPPGSGRFAYRSADGLVRTARSTGRYHVTVN
ncbi:hypothetical protein GW17_00009415 [Ensete ventricosum]|nr:hypothetical protein GW17_00009415 [Ensete ventricosum]